MKSFFVWCPDDGDKPSRPNVHASDYASAAEQWVETWWSDLDHAEEINACVADDSGHCSSFRVRVEQTWAFTATRAR